MKFSMQTALLSTATLAAAVGLWSCGSSSAPADPNLLARTRVAQYLQWNRVNPMPFLSNISSLGSCANPFTQDLLPDPHDPYYVTVYVNDIGKDAMFQQATPIFPVGTVLVKQKSPNADASNPTLLTIMEKKAAGYNPDNGDWHYAVVSGDATQVQTEGKISNCQNCHHTVKRADYTFRTVYLPNDIYKQIFDNQK